MTLAEIRANVLIWTGPHPDLTNERVDAIINDEMQSLIKPFRFEELEQITTVSSVLGQNYIELPADVYIARELWDSSEAFWLNIGDMDWYKSIGDINSDLIGTPDKFFQYGNRLYFGIYPYDVRNYTLYSARKAAPLVLDADIPELPEDWHSIIEFRAAARCCRMIKAYVTANEVDNMAVTRIGERQEDRTIRRRGRLSQAYPVGKGRSGTY